MKLISTLTLASVLVAGCAFAADAPASAAKPAATSTASTTKAAPDHHCRDGANEKKLAGAARKSYIRKCLADARAAK